jgi:hypothetical protein
MPPSNTNTEIALMKQEIKFTNDAVSRIEKKLDYMSESFATKVEHKDNSDKIEKNNEKIDKLHESVSSINLRIALAT